MIRVDGTPIGFAPRLMELAATIDPALQLHEVLPLDLVGANRGTAMDFLSRLFALASSLALLLSLSAIYSVLSFTVARRTREIGIRVALGAERTRVLTAIFKEPIAQVGAGIVVGELLVGLLSLRHRAGDLAHDEFDAEVADVLDAYDSRLSIEAWVELQGNASEQDKLESILQRFEARASAAVGELEDTARLKLHPFFHEVG